LGIAWGAGLEQGPDKPIMLCTRDTLAEALAGLFAAEGRR
jgi:hypothetical protein